MARVKFYNEKTGKWEYADSAYGSGGTVTDEQIASAVEEYLEEHPIEGGNGEPGADGQDGFSPVATVAQTSNGVTITITDKNGTTTATVVNGKDGKDGQDGAKGDTGEKGDKGDTGAQGPQGEQGIQGEKGETGATGPQGEPGAKGDKGDKGDTGAQGEQGPKGDTGATGPAGAAGKTPVKGTDYFTDADKTEIINAVLAALGGSPVSGYVDADNNIVISTDLANGEYTIKYENADGTFTEIGTFNVGEIPPAYTNLFDPASATLNQRWSNSSFAYKAENGIVVSDYIPITIPADADNPSVLRWRGGSMTGNAGLIYYNASKGVLNASDASTNGAGLNASNSSFTTDENGDGMVYLGFKNGSLQSNWQTGAAYIRLSLYVGGSALTMDDIQNIIITIDEPIVD